MNIAIVGATGLVGRTFLRIIEERRIAYDNLYLYASARSAGTTIAVNGVDHPVLETTAANIRDKAIDVALFSAGKHVSKTLAPVFVETGALVIDNSSAFRMEADVPLVVPEVNGADIDRHHGIIANPNCSTIQSVLPLSVVDFYYHATRVDYTTYQAVSGSGQKGLADLELTAAGGAPVHYPHPIHNNAIPHIDDFQADGFTYEEEKMIRETQKILHREELEVSATCVRVPVAHAHSVSMVITTTERVDLDHLRSYLRDTDGIVVLDDPHNNIYPTPRQAAGTDSVYVGRLRRDRFDEHKIHLFCTADNIRKGAALNAIQILETWRKRGGKDE